MNTVIQNGNNIYEHFHWPIVIMAQTKMYSAQSLLSIRQVLQEVLIM